MTHPARLSTNIVPTPNLCFADPPTAGTLNLPGAIQMSDDLDDPDMPVDRHSHSRGIIYAVVGILGLYAVALFLLACQP